VLDTLLDLATTAQFQAGLRAGIVSLIVAIPLGLWWRQRTGQPAPIAGVLLATATLLALTVTRSVPLTIWGGIVLLGAAGLLASLAPSPGWRVILTAIAAIPGALFLGYISELPGRDWAPWLVVLGIVAAGPLVADFDVHHRQRAWGPPLLAISILGLLVTVPDTEEALVLAGVALPLAVLGSPVRLASLGRAGALMAVGIFLLVTTLGGVGRESSMVGAAASLGLLVAEPLARLLRGPVSRLDRLYALGRSWRGAMVVGGVQLALVLVTSRVAGLQDDLALAIFIAAFALVTATALSAIPVPEP
jgi:hypothetical protein